MNVATRLMTALLQEFYQSVSESLAPDWASECILFLDFSAGS
jgi:hypothetical protein